MYESKYSEVKSILQENRTNLSILQSLQLNGGNEIIVTVNNCFIDIW